MWPSPACVSSTAAAPAGSKIPGTHTTQPAQAPQASPLTPLTEIAEAAPADLAEPEQKTDPSLRPRKSPLRKWGAALFFIFVVGALYSSGFLTPGLLHIQAATQPLLLKLIEQQMAIVKPPFRFFGFVREVRSFQLFTIASSLVSYCATSALDS